MHIRLEKVNHIRRQRRYCVISSGQTLFGEWFVQRETGRIGSQGAQQSVEYVSSWQEAYEAIEQMKMITLEKVLWSLHTMTTQIEVDPAVAEGARVAVQRMIDMSKKLGL